MVHMKISPQKILFQVMLSDICPWDLIMMAQLLCIYKKQATTFLPPKQ